MPCSVQHSPDMHQRPAARKYAKLQVCAASSAPKVATWAAVQLVRMQPAMPVPVHALDKARTVSVHECTSNMRALASEPAASVSPQAAAAPMRTAAGGGLTWCSPCRPCA